MLRKIFDYKLSLVQPEKRLHKFKPLVSALDNFFYEPSIQTTRAPHIRDAIDVKRWMLLVVVSLIPCILMAIWNTGLQSFVYSSGNFQLMNEYLQNASSFNNYMDFVLKDSRFITILKEGLSLFLPIVLISYLVGGLWEGIFAVARGHEISEGFLVTGILYALILPPTIPYWMVAVGVSAGIVLAKEVFGGSGMNIVNPALACRAFLFFTFPAKMSGNVWVGSNPTVVRESLVKMNQEAQTQSFDGYTQATPLSRFNVTSEIKRIHIDTIAANTIDPQIANAPDIQTHLEHWKDLAQVQNNLGDLSHDQLKSFVTSPITEGGLGLSPGYYEDAYAFTGLNYGAGHDGDWNLFLGDKLGSMGETSILASLLGAIFLIYTGIGSWRTMLGMGIGAFVSAYLFEIGAKLLGTEGGLWNPAIYAFPAYKHLLLGGLVFGAVFMATDPVSSPSMPSARWAYGILCGVLTIVIREINPAYPEGTMLAILIGNIFAPLIDYYAALNYTKIGLRHGRVAT